MQRNSNLLFKGILRTPPMKIANNSDTILFSALNQVNCRAYILAAKSFLRFYPNVSVVVQDDGDLGSKCIDELRHHLNGITIYTKESMFNAIEKCFTKKTRSVMPPIADYGSRTPVRILYLKCFNVIARFPDKKVLFIDSDMVLLKPHDAISKWIDTPYQYDIYGEGGSHLAEKFHKIGFNYKCLDVSNFNSGFIGIGGKIDHIQLEAVLKRIRDYDPAIFYEWEVEQSVWATLLAERMNPVNLDELEDVFIGSGWRTYDDLKNNAVLAHFVGAIRFKNFRYLRLARRIINELKKQQ
jgi:hypothetical protein